MKKEMLKTWRESKRVKRVRGNLTGTPERPRLAVAKSNKNISAQIIDDTVGRTLCAVTTGSKEFRAQGGYGGNKQAATAVGKALGTKAKQLGIERVCLDRRGAKFHGRVKALADAAREAGLQF